ncbi:MAG TPA: PAS domain-containing sensor histidine kinase [Thermoanaerobaculia bacterium]|jgi:PAS domain S-box-containing protein|nr:PAS domain-containing sensor histidine kinase [Thermoanaerobaculia bacterium]
MAGLDALKSVLPRLAQMKVNTAIGLICCGTALWFLVRHPERRALVRFFVAVVLAIGTLTIVEYLSGHDFGIDQLLFTDPAGVAGTLSPGRMAPTTAINFLLTGLALLLLDLPGRGNVPALLATIAGFVGIQTFLGYVFGGKSQFAFERYTQMPVHAAVAFVALAAGILFARPDRGMMAVISASGGAGRIARNLLPAAFLLPLLLGILASAGFRAGYLDIASAWALFVGVSMTLFAVLIWLNARSVMAFDRKRRQLIETVPAMIWERRYDQNGELARSYVSPYVRTLLGYTEEEWLSSGDFWQRTVDTKDLGVLSERLRDVVTSSTSMLCRMTSKDGTQLWTEVSTSGFGGSDGDRSGTRTVMVDATASINATIRREVDDKIFNEFSTLNNEMATMQRTLVQQQVELRAMNEEKNHFIGMAAHDLRNPLSSILMFSEVLLRQGTGGDAKQIRMIEQIKSVSQKMTEIVNDFLDVSKIESGELSLNLDDVDLNVLVAEVLELQRPAAARKETRLEFTPEPERLDVRADSGKIEQVVTNLITNAVKFSPHGSTIRVRIVRRDGMAILSVTDEGPGIAADEIPRLFRPFQRGSAVVTGQEQSVGLGLVICKKIVEGHGGRIWIESEMGNGATFYVELPLGASSVSASVTASTALAAEPSAPISRQSDG